MRTSSRRVIALLGAGWMFDAMDGTLLAILLPVLIAAFGLTTSEAGLIASVDRVGALVGAAVAGILADRWGRRVLLQAMLLVYALGTGALALTSGLAAFIGVRFVVGFGLGGEMPAVTTLASELLPVRQRGFLMGLFNSFFNYGFLLATLVGLVVAAPFGWRAAFAVGALPSILVVVLRRWLPESPHFVAGRSTTRSRIRELFSPLHRRSTLLMSGTWFALYATAYAIYAWLPTLLVARGLSYLGSLQYTLVAGIAQIVGNLAGGYLADRIGRRPALATLLVMAATSAWLFGVMRGPIQSLALVVALGFCAAGAFAVATAYAPELFPAAIRGSGVGITTSIGRVGGALAPFTVGAVLQAAPGPGGQETVFTLIAICFMAAALLVGSVARETRDRDLGDAFVATGT